MLAIIVVVVAVALGAGIMTFAIGLPGSACAGITGPTHSFTIIENVNGYNGSAFHSGEWTATNSTGPLTVSIVLLTILLSISPHIGVPHSASTNFSSPGAYQTSPMQTSPYITTFPVSQNSSDFTPFLLYPASNRTVWIV